MELLVTNLTCWSKNIELDDNFFLLRMEGSNFSFFMWHVFWPKGANCTEILSSAGKIHKKYLEWQDICQNLQIYGKKKLGIGARKVEFSDGDHKWGWGILELLKTFIYFFVNLSNNYPLLLHPITPTIQYSNTPLLLQPNTLNFRVMRCRSIGV